MWKSRLRSHRIQKRGCVDFLLLEASELGQLESAVRRLEEAAKE